MGQVLQPSTLDIPIFSDGRDPIDTLSILLTYVDQLGKEVGLDFVIHEAVSMYACVDHPVIVLQGSRDNKFTIYGVTINEKELPRESAIYQKWSKNRASNLRVKDVHDSILQVQGTQAS